MREYKWTRKTWKCVKIGRGTESFEGVRSKYYKPTTGVECW